MISRFFIDRPVLASVIAWMTVLFGVIALSRLPVEQYPEITPPTVRVTTSYPGASAQVVADTVASPIEQQVNGVEHMLYMSSTAGSDGSYSLTITFEIGTDLDLAQTQVQNRVSIAQPQLPEEVRRQGLVVKKQSTSIVMVVGLTSPNGTHDSLFLTNYAALRLRDELSRIDGVGEVEVAGGGTYSMRIWLDADKLRAYGLTAQDVVLSLAEQNVQVAAGAVGQEPDPSTAAPFRYTVTALGRLSEPEQFEDIVVKTGPTGRAVFLRDIARVELGGLSYESFSLQRGLEAAALLIYQRPGSNALDVAEGVRALMTRLSKQFPEDVTYDYPYDTTLFVDASVKAVYQTILEAGVLVLIVILVFLQDWRATLVPATTVPVTIVGTFGVMYLLGFSINLLSLFGLVLAIGIVVDDAIVIVENAAHHVERGLPPREATIKAMSEVTGPVMGITLVLMAVFLPAACMGGTTGQMYRQFALTIAATALISAMNAVTLKPVQCAGWLKPPPARRNIFARAFNAFYSFLEWVYVGMVRGLVRWPAPMLALYLGLTGLAGWLYYSLPKSFLPTEDQGFSIVAMRLPDAASLDRTRDVALEVSKILDETPGVRSSFCLGGFSLFDQAAASNAAALFINFEPWEDRLHKPGQSQDEILGILNGRFAAIKEAEIFAFAPPAILGLGLAGGFQLNVEDRDNVGPLELQAQTEALLAASSGNPIFGPATTTFRATFPQVHVEIDRVKLKKMDLTLAAVFGTLQAYLGSVYVNDFNKFGRTYQVRLQAAESFRRTADDLRRLEARNNRGQMVPLAAVLDVEESVGPQFVTRYNLYPTATINGMAAPGVSSGQALEVMEGIADEKLPKSMGYEWTGMAFEEKRVGSEVFVVFGLAVLMVYLVLAGQYESRLLPLAVIFVVPLGVLGVATAANVRGFANDVYTQIGVVLIIALASKNAILIVEFARELRAHGKSIREAAVEASRMRFRPILMTSFAFILGVVPLVEAEGAGAAARQSLGTAVFGGMIASTVLAVFFVPVFYVVFQGLAEWRKPRGAVAKSATPAPHLSAAALGHANGHGHAPEAAAAETSAADPHAPAGGSHLAGSS
jgi:HAE1 family hydrophobic/amphiphilic exporter-1